MYIYIMVGVMFSSLKDSEIEYCLRGQRYATQTKIGCVSIYLD
jgi:hypothetical protein